MKITKAQYQKLLTYIGCGDLAEADIIIFGNEEGTGGNDLSANIVARCDYFGKNKEGCYTDCVNNEEGENSGYWQKNSQAGGEIVKSLSVGESQKDSKEGTKWSSFLLSIARMVLALEHPEIEVETWFKEMGEDSISEQVRKVRDNGLFTGSEKGTKLGLMDWRPLPRRNEECIGAEWPSEYEGIDDRAYLSAFNYNKSNKPREDNFSNYTDDVKTRKQIINNFFKTYPKRIIIGLGDIDTKKRLLMNIFEGISFTPMKDFGKALHGVVEQEGGSLNIYLLPFPMSGLKSFKAGEMLPYFERFTKMYLVPVFNDLTNVSEETVEVNDYANNGKRYTESEKRRLDEIAETLNTKAEMYERAADIATEFRRTEVAVCKQIEDRKGWFFRAR